ncbi:ATP-dependent zinc metalloprotease FtsH [Tautonia sociabilis]|uniref:ATP-dependent zinc metalloprotease FtsH n=1 Tax=Tautonia sociabilis TaxID=2080755 RepID=A0A432MQ83_9BACT|nr:ATP-dependent zinc metalloprotease FtsH [Tautonia sociabilis]RUL89634.1 ATP-dependent metallopeptidase FtsH/Yme1/Tma family protein [Tautonia sociabilis]
MENQRAPQDGDSTTRSRAPERRKAGNGGGSGGGSSGTPTPPWSLLFLIAAMVLVFLMWNPFRAEVRVNYSPWFLDQVASDNIESITIQGSEARGKLRQPDTDYKASPNAAATTVSHFVTTIPTEKALDEILEALESDTIPGTDTPRNKPEVTVLEPSTPTTLLWVSFLLPMVLIGGLIFFMMRRARDQFDGGILGNFVKSPAKRHDKSKQRTTFDEVAGLENAKAELQEIVEFLKTPEKFQRLGGRIPKGVLLIGPPGSGKTLMARAVAGEAGVPFFSISGSEFIQMFVGVGASRVRDMFKTAKENSPCILFIDEIDAVGRVRGAGLGGGHDEREQTLNQILTEMDGFTPSETVIVLAATNRPDVLDPALLRPGRFDRHVTVDRPTRKGRLEILKVHTRHVPLADEVDLDAIARSTVGMSGADLANLVNEAALIATRENKDKVDMKDFDAARDKVIMGAKREEFITQKDKRATAYHEAGHALVAWMTPKTDPVHKVTIIPRGRSLGVTQFLPEEDRLGYSESQIRARLDVLLGGRAAEKLVYDDLSTGAAEDLKQATRLARMMVTQWGMSPRVGPVYVQGSEEHPFLGREMTEPRDHSEHTQQVIDEEVARILREADQRSYRLLEEHRAQLDRLADALIEREVISDVEIEELIGQRVRSRDEPRPDEVVVSVDHRSDG